MPRQRLRSIFDLQRDETLPSGIYGEGGDGRFRPEGRRFRAIEEVLCSLPEEHYEQWKSRINEVAWFIPDHRLWGRVGEFPNKKIIYLNPFLECVESDSAVIGLVVHEVAHFLLNHVGPGVSWQEKEQEADQAVREWGFAEETEAKDRELGIFFQPSG
jgi:hypothetical protein